MINETQQLSERERQILYLVASGRSNQQIANELGISINTVKVHLRNVFGKIGAASRTEASMYAVRAGIITVDRALTSPATTVDAEPALESPGDEPVVEQTAPPEANIDVPPTTESGVQAVETSLVPQEASRVPQEASRVPDEPVDVQQAVVSPVTGPGSDIATASSSRRPMRILALVALCLVAVTLAGAAVAWLVQADDPVSNQTQESTGFNLARWRELPTIPTSRAAFAMAAVEDQLYVIAGENEAGVLNTGQRYDPRSRKWSEIAQKPTPATDIRVARLGERLYVPGGRRSADQKDISAALERYDPRADRWEKLADMPQPRSGYALAALEGRLYVFGGWDGSAFRDTVFAYDPQSDNWSELEAMPTARAFADASVVEGSIFVVGGENKAGPVASNEQYVPSQEDTQPWVNRAPMPRPRSRFSSAVALSNIYVFGGDNASDTLQYDARAERWQSFEAPAVIGSQPGVTLFDEVVVIVGGRDAAGAFSTKMYSYQALFRTLLPGS